MSILTEHCTPQCAAMPECTVCGLRKRPVGRSVAIEAENSYCGYHCPWYTEEPRPGHLWPNEWREHVAGEGD